MTDDSREVVGRAITGSGLTVIAQGVTTVFGLARSIILARILAPEAFGAVALALFYVSFLASISTFGLNAALIQREGESQAAIATHFTLRLSLALVGFVLTLAILPLLGLFYDEIDGFVPAVAALAAVELVIASSSTPLTILNRRLAFKRIASINIISSVGMTIVAPMLAYNGWGIWSLIFGERAVGALVSFGGGWVYRRPWKPSIKYDRQIAHDYLKFGKHVLFTGQLAYLLDRFDDFWTGSLLGSGALGFYTKSYEFARYPRRLIASPLSGVLFSGYARLQHDREMLSKFFFRSASLIFRVNCLFSVALFVIVPEFVSIIGERWEPMIVTFRLLILYSLFDPLFVTSSSLTTAVGHPQMLTRIRIIQLIFFVPAVIVLSHYWQINGVAVAADLMLLVGIGSVLRAVRKFISFSIMRLLLPPLFAALVAGVVGLYGGGSLLPVMPLWLLLIVKSLMVMLAFTITILAMEWRELTASANFMLNILKNHKNSGSSFNEGGK